MRLHRRGKGVGTRGDNAWLTSPVANNSRESEGEEKRKREEEEGNGALGEFDLASQRMGDTGVRGA